MTDERKPEEHVEDLDVPESESEDVKGGLLPAIEGSKFSKFQKFHKIDVSHKIDPGNLGGRLGDGSV
jgi:hypothetical protein